MTLKEYLLNRLSEECAEVIQRVSKALTFGLDEVQPGQEHNNAYRIILEYIDLVTVFEMLEDEGILELPDGETVRTLNRKKREKVAYYMQLSRERGTLTD